MVSLQVPANSNYGIDQYTKLLVRAGDATTTNIKDFSGLANSLSTIGSITGSTTKTIVNPHSLYYPSSGCGLSRTSTNLVSRTSDFWIEGWFYFSDSSNYVLFSQGNGTGNYVMWYNSTTTMMFTAYTGAARGNSYCTPGLSNSVWTHLAAGRSGSTFYFFKNGVPLTTTTDTAWGDVNPASAATYIAEDSGYGGGYKDFTGYIDEFKYDIGVCRFTKAFTPSTRPYVDRGW